MSKRILLIDDEVPLRRVVQLTLYLTAGWEVISVGSGEEALQQAEIQQPDAILLDLMMPDMDGLSILSRLRANLATQHIPIIVMTAKVQALYQLEYQQLGIAAIFIKPFEPTTLVQQVKTTLGWD
ncbi:MAG: response regulator [Leptolyngbyaceae cyanobacterium SL_7_1]|nr:response regulator [Leptolyngbyaceae cyanobacterium SL_7_1]